MIFLGELAFIILLIVIVVFCARPIAEAYSEKMRTKAKEVGSDRAHALEKKVEQLEADILDLRQQLKEAKESTDFVLRLVNGEEGTEGAVIKTTSMEAEKASGRKKEPK